MMIRLQLVLMALSKKQVWRRVLPSIISLPDRKSRQRQRRNANNELSGCDWRIENERSGGGNKMPIEVCSAYDLSHVPDKDNDLRCRVNKRANLIYGNGPSPEKDAFIEEEFKKRQRKRKGKISSPSPEDERLHASVHNPEFANVLMMVLLQKGLSQEDATSLLETLKSNPEALKSFMATSTGAPAESTEEQQDETTNEAEEMSEVPQYMLHTTEYVDTHGLDASQILLASQGLPFENMPTDSTEYATELPPELQSHLDEERAIPISIQIPVPIPVQSPAMEVKNEPVAEAIPIPPVPPMPPLHVTPVRQPIPTIPMPPMNYPPIPPLPTYIPPATPPASTSQPLSQDRVRALGFPPRMAQPPQTAQPKATHSA